MKRIDDKTALDLLANADLAELGAMAEAVRKELHPDDITTFIVDRNINYTNACWVDCKFCAFYKHEKDENAYILSLAEIDAKIDELLAVGGTQILFQGGVHPKLKIEWYEDLVRHISEKYPQITIHGFSANEIEYISRLSRISIEEVLVRLRDAGLYSIPGAGAEILSNRVRKLIAPKKLMSQKWLEVHETAHKIGMKSTATMMFGTLENDEDIVEHLRVLRELQDRSGGFRAFICWSFQSSGTALIREFPEIKKQSPARYLRILALARIYLDNFKNVQSSWVTQGSAIGQLALRFGANDLGSTMLEENVVSAAGTSYKMSQNEMIRLIRELGLKPAKRNTNYDILEKYF